MYFHLLGVIRSNIHALNLIIMIYLPIIISIMKDSNSLGFTILIATSCPVVKCVPIMMNL